MAGADSTGREGSISTIKAGPDSGARRRAANRTRSGQPERPGAARYRLRRSIVRRVLGARAGLSSARISHQQLLIE